ncbi:hypothetical protein P167DRAFT_578664 [Morchella conica CCBAS932]|uniref:Uncharacterized protein n=1 Tax=Morchella conica CCBAS932 TaxID=1392247 RepID=A0A3N4KI98_9PEZI|nr:hypothetical protein P167DRAFT_578664 [Morchella conica CCBAS932]
MTLPGVHLSRGESISTSSLTRKNTPTSQGHRYDGVLRYHDLEIGAVEHAREWVGTYGRKWGADTRKIVKVLHDMLVAAEISVGCEEAFRNVVLAGVVTAGMLFCPSSPGGSIYGGGYVCVVSRGQEVRRVPTSLKDAGELFALAAELWGLRILVQQTIAILEDCEDAKRKRYFEELKDGEKTFVARLPRLRPCIDTDDPDE